MNTICGDIGVGHPAGIVVTALGDFGAITNGDSETSPCSSGTTASPGIVVSTGSEVAFATAGRNASKNPTRAALNTR